MQPMRLRSLRRSWVLPVWHAVMLALSPWQRQVGIGASRVLERPPKPGMLGVVADLLRATTGALVAPVRR